MMWRRTFGGGVAIKTAAVTLALAIPSCLFAQVSPIAGTSRSLSVTAENTVPGITRDGVSVNGAAGVQPNPAPPSVKPSTNTASLSPSNFPRDATMMKMPSTSEPGEVTPTIGELRYGTRAERRLYAMAVAAFPSFCQDWARKLRVRESDNLSSLNFQEKSGYETASYVGYGPIKSCECKETSEGVPLAKVTYDEQDYFLEGKTIDEAKHNPPKLVGITHTLEIFNWDQGKWFY